MLALGAMAAGLVTAVTTADTPALDGLDGPHRARAEALLRSHDLVVRQLRGAPGGVSAVTVKALATQALSLVERHQTLEQYVRLTPEAVVRAERDRLKRLAVTSNDAAASQRYREAMSTRDEQLADSATMRTQAARLDAEISSVHAKLDAIHTQLLKLKSLQSESGLSDASDRVHRDLSELSHELGALADAYASLTEHPSRVSPQEP